MNTTQQILIFLILLVGLMPASAQYRMGHPNSFYLPENWPQHTLRFSDPGMFVDIFDSGLKPYYFPGSEKRMLEVKHVRLTVTDAYGKSYPELCCETIEIRPRKSGRIYDFQCISQSMTYEQARDAMSLWLPYINIAPAELEIFLENVRKKPTGYDDPNFGTHKKGFGGGWTGKNKERYFVWFRKAYSYEVPLRLGFRVDWSYSMNDREQSNKFTEAIPAPEGYQIQPRPQHFGPDDSGEMMHAKGIPFMKGFGLGGEGTLVVELDENQSNAINPKPKKQAPEANAAANTQNKQKSNHWFKNAIVLLSITLAALLIFHATRKIMRKH